MPDLRKAFWERMELLTEIDEDIILLAGDLGFSFYETFAAKFPKQFINCGIAEQNMVGIAAGLALSGKKPFVYSGSVLLISRAYDQIRDDVAYANLPVTLIGTGASDFLGYTHNWNKNESEVNLLKGLPNIIFKKLMTRKQVEKILRVAGKKQPLYIRL